MRFNRSSAKKSLILNVVLVVLAVVLLFTATAFARVAWVEITDRSPFAGGASFGDVGPYEKITGKLHYAVDPNNPYNARIVDLDMARTGRLRADITEVKKEYEGDVLGDDPRNAAGEVTFAGDFILLKPIDLSQGNHRLLYDVNNRGRLLMLGYYNDAPATNDPSTLEHAGNGWLMRQGYSLLWSAWNWDVERIGQKPLRINLPVIVEENGGPMTARINAELTIQDTDGVQVEPIAWGGSRCYPVAEGTEKDAVLSVRDLVDVDGIGPRKVIPRDQWQFARLDKDGKPVYSSTQVYLPGGFEKGKIYELIYTAKNPRVVGLDLAAVRDAISFFHFESLDDKGAPNPLLVGNGSPDPKYAYIFGISQSGRFATHMIYQGFHVDEKGRMVFEGARPQVSGGGKGSFNYRWAQTTHHPKHKEANYFPADFFPFNYTEDGVEQFDPLGQEGRKYGDVLAVAKQLGKVPKIMVGNHGLEYWTRAASLVHTNVSGTADITLHPNVRIYMVNGARHGSPGAGSKWEAPLSEHAMSHLDQRPAGRALLVALDEWVTYGIEPPPSTVPRIDKGELITAKEHQARFPKIPEYRFGNLVFPATRHPGVNLTPPRADYGPRFWTEGIQDYVPPRYFGLPYQTLVPAFNSDGNGIGGIRVPDLAVPLGTYQAFNPRRTGTGAEDTLRPFDSSFWPFASTEKERTEKDDPRPSIEARYANKADYVKKVKVAAEDLRLKRLLLEEDEARIVAFAEALAWPPQPIEGQPLWKMEK